MSPEEDCRLPEVSNERARYSKMSKRTTWTLSRAVHTDVPHSDCLIGNWSQSLAPVQEAKASLRRTTHFSGRSPAFSQDLAELGKRAHSSRELGLASWNLPCLPGRRAHSASRRVFPICPSHNRIYSWVINGKIKCRCWCSVPLTALAHSLGGCSGPKQLTCLLSQFSAQR